MKRKEVEKMENETDKPKEYRKVAEDKIKSMNVDVLAYSLFGGDKSKEEREELNAIPEVVVRKEATKKAREEQKATEKEALPYIFQNRDIRKAISRDLALSIAGKQPKVQHIATFEEAEALYKNAEVKGN
jgi:hypothetical protein